MRLPAVAILVTVALTSSCSGQYTKWEKNITINNIEFKKIRYGLNESDTTVIIGFLKQSTFIDGYRCKANWIHLNKNRKPVLFQLDEETVINNIAFQKDSWIIKDGENLACVFVRDTVIQGYLCRGGGGPKGIQTSFYTDGNLKSFFARGDVRIGKVKCQGGIIHPVILYENGTLKECTLAEDFMHQGNLYTRGTNIVFDSSGKPKR
jgi:hypothetical protein